ncbi:uncharacterized protein LOC125227504 [Leguminivora glycinivorella]|uniref:uncharacterized protein LOC125227504 n=1 Tax=Leguminivora glycinivorella TaxID=1035111 RepID=UPI00201015F5|nr:uncharacterized protein LOC125227504 [Leguminivora glycinivorella]XP_047987794.1 uncharacterized protein LOC125227504 [Leguminivora glycinivorella]
MAPDSIGDNDKAEELPLAQNAQVEDSTSAVGYPKASDGATNEQWHLLMQTQNTQMMELISMMNEPPPNVCKGQKPESASITHTWPDFNPEEEGADALAWCKAVDFCLGQHPLQGAALITALSKSLKGSASSWLPQVTYEDMTWNDFKFNFLACYDSQNTCAATMISINNSRPKEEESYAAYASRIVNSLLTRWKDLSAEQIAVSFALAHISRFDSRVQRMAHVLEITTQDHLFQELSGFSYLKHKLQTNPNESDDVTPQKQVKKVPIHIQRPAKKRNSKKHTTATATSSKSDENIVPENFYELKPNADENMLKIKLVKSSNITIERPAKKRKGSKPKTATATSSNPMDMMPEICYHCGEGGHNAIECPKTDTASGLSEPGPSRSAGTQRHMDSGEHDCVCCGPQPATKTLRQPETISYTDVLAGPSSTATNGIVYIEISTTENKDHNVQQSNREDVNVIPAVSLLEPSQTAPKTNNNKAANKYVEDVNQNVIQANVENSTTDVYAELVLLEQRSLVPNTEEIECGVCIDTYQPGQGVILRECVHAFCKECLSDVVKHSEDPAVSCPATGCPGLLQQREIRALVSPEDYERWLAKGLAAAESGARNAFHCRTTDCQGWAMCDPDVARFHCPVCDVINCVTCQAIHENETCAEYRAKQRPTDEQTKTYLDSLLSRGEAMRCPECSVIITKQLGCDWLMCTACKTEICWATRGRRWGPRGRGDNSGGCQCRVKRKKCHPNCHDCH